MVSLFRMLFGQKSGVPELMTKSQVEAIDKIERLQKIKIVTLEISKSIKNTKKVQPAVFSTIIQRLQKTSVSDGVSHEIKKLVNIELTEKDVKKQILNMNKIVELIDGEIAQIKKQNKI